MEIDVGDHKYFVGQMKAPQQRNVLRRVFPLITASGEVMKRLALAMGDAAAAGAEEDPLQAALGPRLELSDLFSAAGPIADKLSGMKDEDFDYIFSTCLAVVKRQVPGGVQDIAVISGDLRFTDITLAQQFQLIFAVLRENFSDFFPELLGLWSGGKGQGLAPPP